LIFRWSRKDRYDLQVTIDEKLRGVHWDLTRSLL
jgi:hypothetical protein